MNRYFTQMPLAIGASVQLEAAIEKHAVKVLRQTVGSQMELANGQGQAFLATIQSVEPLVATVQQDITKPVELPMAVHLVCGVSKGEKAEWIVQKAVELGVASIAFANMQWGTAKWVDAKVGKKLARLQAIALGAAEQSHRNVVPTVSFVKLSDLSLTPGAAGVVAYEEAAKDGETAQLIQTVLQKPSALWAVFGPEGGLSPQEVAKLVAVGFKPAGLGPRIMRTETAPLYLLSAISALTELQEI